MGIDGANGNGALQRRLVKPTDLPPQLPDHVRFCLISDTHERHHGYDLPPCDVIVHSGDVLDSSRFASELHVRQALVEFDAWLARQPCPVRLVVAGNHDVGMAKLGREQVAALLQSATYLEYDTVTLRLPTCSAVMSVDGPVEHAQTDASMRFGEEGSRPSCCRNDGVEITVYGAPYSRGRSRNTAFRDEQRLLDCAPARADVVVTHGPTESERAMQCIDKLDPLLHVFGHEHENHSQIKSIGKGHGYSVNAAVTKGIGFGRQRPINPAIVVDVRIGDGTSRDLASSANA